jgi:hypothetical protein
MMKLSIVDQVITATRANNKLAACLGAAVASVPPVICFTASRVLHAASVSSASGYLTMPATYIVGGCLVLSAFSVAEWATKFFGSPVKGIGFTVAVEGTMTFLGVEWLAYVCLALLIAINGVAAGCRLVMDRQEVRAEVRASRPKASARTKAKSKAKPKSKARKPVSGIVKKAA